MSAQLGLGLVLALLGGVFATFSLYQLLLALAAFRYEPPGAPGSPGRRVAVLVPAHDEAALIERCVRSLSAQTYPQELYEVIVIADNCGDDTAALARKAGAVVLERREPDARGKGQALRWALDRVLASKPPPDSVAIVDADSVANPDFLEMLNGGLEAGAGVVQGESLLFENGSAAAALRAGAFLLVNRVQPAGRSALGLGCTLQGNGMMLSAGVLRAHPWDAFTATEDLEYSIRLLLAGVNTRFAAGAIVRSPAPPTREAAARQQLRWEGGKLHMARTQLARLLAEALRQRRPGLFEAALYLAVPPLGLLSGGTIAGTAFCAVVGALGIFPSWSIVPWAVALTAIPLYVLIGFRAARAPASAYRSLARAPLLILNKLGAAHRVLVFRSDTWVRTERESHERDVRQ
jgi:cellulose synthase/poly-beta-1,6-N-acetylglucosamine synthase-like glycosyltransferase